MIYELFLFSLCPKVGISLFDLVDQQVCMVRIWFAMGIPTECTRNVCTVHSYPINQLSLLYIFGKNVFLCATTYGMDATSWDPNSHIIYPIIYIMKRKKGKRSSGAASIGACSPGLFACLRRIPFIRFRRFIASPCEDAPTKVKSDLAVAFLLSFY